jgi:hypothetical protein
MKKLMEKLEKLLYGKSDKELEKLLGLLNEDKLEELAVYSSQIKNYLRKKGEKKREEGEKKYEKYMREGRFDDAAIVAIKYYLDTDKREAAARKLIKKYIKSGLYNLALGAAYQFGLGSELTKIAKEVYEEYMRNGYFAKAKNVAWRFPLSEDMEVLAEVLTETQYS